MNKELQEYIKNLSLKDKKNLSQKLGKVMEESGELARVVLPYDGADGTTHRFVEKERVLEESVDVVLTAISIAYELGFTHDDIEKMMWIKAQKWQGIQAKEEKVDYPIPYEIHITVDLDNYVNRLNRLEMEYESGQNIKPGHNPLIGAYISNMSKEDLEEQAILDFKETCKKIGVKPIVIDLENNGMSVMKDVMTSSHIIGNNTTSYEECVKIARALREDDFLVVRQKIETVPWHPAAPSNPGDKMPEDCYFEAHIGCTIFDHEESKLSRVVDDMDVHVSKNFFKKKEDGRLVKMITMRKYDKLYDDFTYELERLKSRLDANNIDYEKVITEFSIYDTKVSHDFKWLENKKETV
jgi:NTP pyrophosphatase (non-canonical NTP hydrolase)